MKPKHKFSDRDGLEEVVKNSLSKAQVLRQLGITPAGGNYKTLNYYIKLYSMDTSHFTGSLGIKEKDIHLFVGQYL